MDTKEVAIRLKAEYQIGVAHRKKGLTIQTKANFITQHQPIVADHALILDLYYAYTRGYRATAPTPLQVMVGHNGR